MLGVLWHIFCLRVLGGKIEVFWSILGVLLSMLRVLKGILGVLWDILGVLGGILGVFRCWFRYAGSTLSYILDKGTN